MLKSFLSLPGVLVTRNKHYKLMWQGTLRRINWTYIPHIYFFFENKCFVFEVPSFKVEISNFKYLNIYFSYLLCKHIIDRVCNEITQSVQKIISSYLISCRFLIRRKIVKIRVIKQMQYLYSKNVFCFCHNIGYI